MAFNEEVGSYAITNPTATDLPAQLLNINGQSMEQLSLKAGTSLLNMNAFPSGLYVLKTPRETIRIVKP